MCGIAGYLTSNKLEHQVVLERMGNAIEHRGPDAMGIWVDEEKGIGICHRRLSIIDLSEAGAQPMSSCNNEWVIAFNGEVYNFQILKAELENEIEGIKWRGHSDTEVIIKGFEVWGIRKTVTKMVGMFSIALWDRNKSELYLIRDRIGEKPIYFGWQGNTFLFASELKSLHQHPDFEKQINSDALGDFFKYNYIPSGKSIYKNIEKLCPGYYCKVSIRNRAIDYYQYWSVEESFAKETQYDDLEPIISLERLLKDSVSKQMISDVSLGAFLSGGVDSSLVVALMQMQSKNAVKTFSIGFADKEFDEARYAKKVAQYLGTEHTELYVTSDEALNIVPKLPDIYDEPFSDSSQIPTFLVSQLARKEVTVSLSGDAGDELFSGYTRYSLANNMWNKLSKIPIGIRSNLAGILSRQRVSGLNKVYNTMEFVIPRKYRFSNFGDKMHKVADKLSVSSQSELYDKLLSHWDTKQILSIDVRAHAVKLEDSYGLSFIEKMMLADTKAYLPDDILVKVDRAAMANSLETRVPFLDHRVVEFAWKLPMRYKIRDGKGKWILREILYRHVPQELIERPKMGFAIPLDNWLKKDLKDWAGDLLSPTNLDKHGFLNKTEIQTKFEEHISGKRNWQYQLWDVLMFQSWYNRYHS